MKKTYDRPHTRTFLLHASPLMLRTSVNNYKQGDDITVGDTDEDESGSGKARHYVDWNGW